MLIRIRRIGKEAANHQHQRSYQSKEINGMSRNKGTESLPKQHSPKTRLSKSKACRVIAAKGASSTRWLQRQLSDPYVAAAHKECRRSRAAFKLLEMQKKNPFLEPSQTVLDLGASPGGWTEAAHRLLFDSNMHFIAVDLQPIAP